MMLVSSMTGSAPVYTKFSRRLLLGGLAATAAASQQRRPNIVFILADDLGYGDLGCYGQKQIATPRLDQMAREGMRFTQAYAGSTVCAPSRCTLFTGLHTGHAYIRGNGAVRDLRPSDATVAELLQKADYRTAMFGKYALGHLGESSYPLDRGFDEWFGYFSQTHAHNYYPEQLLDGRRALELSSNTGTQKKTWAPDLFADRAVRFIEKTPADQPFFLYLATVIPHANNELGRDTKNGMEVPDDKPYSDRPWPQVEKNFAAMVTRLDVHVGRVLDALKATGRDQDTIIFFSSDNGSHSEGGHDPRFFASSGPLRGQKRDLYEGGIRVPMLVRWPGKIQAGAVNDHPWAFWDVLPTLTDLAGTQAPAGLDGHSVVPTLLGRTGQKQHESLYWEFHERGFSQAVRMGKWKGVKRGKAAAIELYDLTQDVGETKDLAAANPAVVKQIQALMQSSRTDAPEWPVK
jgi:arylsulfatase A-like enzyme